MSLQAQLIPSNGLKMNSPTVSNRAKNYAKPSWEPKRRSDPVGVRGILLAEQGFLFGENVFAEPVDGLEAGGGEMNQETMAFWTQPQNA